MALLILTLSLFPTLSFPFHSFLDLFPHFDHLKSNPSVREIGWSANNETLPEKNHLGRFVSNHTLLVKNVQSYHSGFYKCWATNLIGKGESDYVNLIVKYSPRCKSSGKIYEVDPGGEQPLNLTCEVDAMPADVSFHWSFQEERSPRENSETNLMKFRSYGLKSILTLEPENAWLYKAVYCWAENRIGLQMDPCVFKLHSSKAPDPPVNCTVSNSSTSSLMVKCLPGPNGRLPQVFHLEAYEVGETHSIRKLLRNLTSKESPQFLLDGYPSDIKLSLHLYASNSKGTSETVLLSIKTTHASRWRTDAEEDYIISALPTIAIMVFSAFISVMITAIIAIRRKTRRVHLQRVETSAEIVNPDLCVFSQTLANSAEILDSESLDVVHKTQLDTQSACLDFDVIPNEDSGYSSALTNKNSLTLASVKGLNQKLMAPSVSSPVKLIATVYYTSCANCDHCQNEEEAYGREGLKDSNGEEEESGDLEKLSQCPECGKF